MNLSHITDTALLKDIKLLVKEERECVTKILHHLREVEKRRLFSDLGFNSLFDYATKDLGYTEAAAARRINAARLLHSIPKLEKRIEDGSLSLTNISKVANLFKQTELTPQKQNKILSRIENKSSRECEKILLDYSLPKPATKEVIKAHSPNVNLITISISDETLKIINELKDLVSHQKLSNDGLWKLAFSVALKKLLSEKYHLNSKETASESSTRYIPASVKKNVFLRDKGKCRTCNGTYKLQFDHILPYAMGGKSSLENLRLLCFSCNQRALIRNGNSSRAIIAGQRPLY